MNALLAIPLLLVPEAPPAAGEAPGGVITYEIRLIDCETLAWREAFQSRLRFGGHRAGSSAWIADEATLGEMVDSFANGEETRVVAAPKVSATPGDPAVIGTSTTRHFVVHAEPAPVPAAEVDGRPMLPHPVVAPVDDGSQVRLAGLPVPEGMRRKVEVVDCRVESVHVVEALEAGGESFKIQVPEVSRREMAGEWVLPPHHSLVLSLGVESAADDEGKPVVRERLLLVTTRQVGHSPAAPSPASDPGVRLTRGMTAPATDVPAPVVDDGPIPTAASSVPFTPPAPPMVGVAFQPAGPISALAATPWGLLPIVPVEVVSPGPAGPEPEVRAVAMPLPTLPSRNLPTAIDADGRAIDPKTEKDREAEQTDFAPFVDGKPVPSPQVTVPSPSPGMATASTGGGVTVPGAPEAKSDRSMIKVRLSLDLARGFVVDLDLGQSPEASGREADAGEAPVRR